MSDHDDEHLNQLLARGRLSGAEYDRVERRVLDRLAPKPRWAFWPVLVPATAAVAAAAAFLLLDPGVPRPPDAGEIASNRDLTPKSSGEPVNGSVSVGCGGTTPLVCRLGDTLMFSVTGRTRAGYLVAYAERVDAAQPERIWYFPSASGAALQIEMNAGTAVLGEGVRLGPPHTPGKYRLTTWISDVPVQRSRAARAIPAGRQSVTFDIE